MKSSLEYAKHLYKQGHCHQALAEYKRLNYFGSLQDSGVIYGMKSALCSDQYSKGIAFYQGVADNGLTLSLTSQKLMVSMLLLSRDFNQFDRLVTDPENSNNWNEANGYSLVLQDRWKELEVLVASSTNEESHLLSRQLLQEYQTKKWKKPWLAASMSTVIPGSGKLYTGEWQDGIFSLIIVSALAWQSQRFFRKSGEESTLGWVSAGFGTLFYISNIYGSHRSAKNVNQRKLKLLHNEVDNRLRDTDW